MKHLKTKKPIRVMQSVKLTESTISAIQKKAIKENRTEHYLRVKAIEDEFGK